MNNEFILQRIEPYLNSKRELSESEFMELFVSGDYPLSLREQYEIIKIMIDNDIEYVDEKDEETEVLENAKRKNINVAHQNIQHLMKLNNEQLCMMAKNNDIAALDALCRKNKFFIYKKAVKIQKQYARCCLTVDDLVQEGMNGMIEAITNFDPEKEFSFLTYAWSRIRQSMERAVINTGFLVRLPVHIMEKLIKINRYRRNNPNANVGEIVQIANEDGYKYSTSEIISFLRYSEQYLNITSLNALVGDGEDSELGDFIPDNSSISIEDEVSALFLQKDIATVFSKLKPREADVLMMRYGFGYYPHTLEEVGVKYQVTRERIRQIEETALRKIRQSYAMILKDYV